MREFEHDVPERAMAYADKKDAERGGESGEGTRLLRELCAALRWEREARDKVIEALNWQKRRYTIEKPVDGWREADSFDVEESTKLRPIAETLAMLDGNAFFGACKSDDTEDDTWFRMYLPEADAIYQANGGDKGWAGLASFIRDSEKGAT